MGRSYLAISWCFKALKIVKKKKRFLRALSQTCAVGGWGPMFGTKSQKKNGFSYTFPKAKTHFLLKGPFPTTELAENSKHLMEVTRIIFLQFVQLHWRYCCSFTEGGKHIYGKTCNFVELPRICCWFFKQAAFNLILVPQLFSRIARVRSAQRLHCNALLL